MFMSKFVWSIHEFRNLLFIFWKYYSRDHDYRTYKKYCHVRNFCIFWSGRIWTKCRPWLRNGATDLFIYQDPTNLFDFFIISKTPNDETGNIDGVYVFVDISNRATFRTFQIKRYTSDKIDGETPDYEAPNSINFINSEQMLAFYETGKNTASVLSLYHLNYVKIQISNKDYKVRKELTEPGTAQPQLVFLILP